MAQHDPSTASQFLAPEPPKLVERAQQRLVVVPKPEEALLKLELPADVIKALKVRLDEAGFRFEADTVSDPGGRCRSITILTDGGVRLFVAFIPAWILDDPTNVDSVGFLGPSFDEGSKVFILSDGDVKPTFAMVFQSWTRMRVEARLVNWSWFKGFADMSPTDQRAAIELSFDVKLTPKGKGARAEISIDRLTSEERELIQDLLARNGLNAGISEKDYFRGFVDEIGLPSEWRKEMADVWVGDAGIDAGKLVNWAFEKGWFPREHEKHDYSVIGAVLQRLARTEVGDEGNRLVGVILKYELIADGQVVLEMRQRLQGTGG